MRARSLSTACCPLHRGRAACFHRGPWFRRLGRPESRRIVTGFPEGTASRTEVRSGSEPNAALSGGVGSGGRKSRNSCRLCVEGHGCRAPQTTIPSANQAVGKSNSIVFPEKECFLGSGFVLYVDIHAIEQSRNRRNDFDLACIVTAAQYPLGFQQDEEADEDRAPGAHTSRYVSGCWRVRSCRSFRDGFCPCPRPDRGFPRQERHGTRSGACLCLRSSCDALDRRLVRSRRGSTRTALG